MNFDYVICVIKDKIKERTREKCRYSLSRSEDEGYYQHCVSRISELQEAINLLESQSGGILHSKLWEESTEEEKEISLISEDFIKEMSQ